jgi:hypothetical protein
MTEAGEVYVLIHGHERSLIDGERDANEYIAAIVYGEPEITTVVTDSGRFVALCEYKAEQRTNASYTFNRMGSFVYGASFFADREIALKEFGSWIYHYTGTLLRGNREEAGSISTNPGKSGGPYVRG